MAFQPVLNTAEISVIYSYHGEIVQNVFYGERPAGYVLADIAALANHMDLQVGVTWVPEQPIEAVYLRVEVRGLSVLNDLFASANANSGPGTDLVAGLPGSVTFSIKKTSGLTGRSARGRCYWIGIPSDKLDATDENRLVAGYVTSIIGNVDVIRLQIPNVPGWLPVLVSRFTGGAQRGAGVTFPWTGSEAVDNVVDTHRNRLP